MAVNAKIVIDNVRFNQVVTGLKRITDDSFLRRFDITPFRDKALRFLKSVFPSSKGGSGSVSDVAEFGQRLVEGWKASPLVSATTLGFKLEHAKDNNQRISVLLESLDTGARASTWIAQEDISFPDFRGRRGRASKPKWIRILEGSIVHHAATPATHYKDKTYDYIRTVLLPELRGKIESAVRREVNG